MVKFIDCDMIVWIIIFVVTLRKENEKKFIVTTWSPSLKGRNTSDTHSQRGGYFHGNCL